ncbi:MAG: recombinase family protein [Candidatus Methanoplasma sp.]|jgi:DNA invertase Pin-like site-specific DNA recombinase|nr:recombinase family protein [Candidatus Methanoplasma sp.]
MMRAAIYVRVSTEEQAEEGYSLDAQKEILENHCIAEGWDVCSIYEDDGYSGRGDRRPAYVKMMEEMDMWDVLLVLKMDRIHRNSRNFMNMMDLISRNGKMFVSSMESLDTTNALGRFVMDMIQRIAQLESEQIGERTYMGMREKAESMKNTPQENRTMGFNPPLGYSLTGGILVAVPGDMETVERIFRSYLSGDTIDTVAYCLNRDNILTRRRRSWNVYNVRNILHNPVYAGYMRWDDVLVRHFTGTAVTPEEFNTVQEMMASRVKNPKNRHVLRIPDEFSD